MVEKVQFMDQIFKTEFLLQLYFQYKNLKIKFLEACGSIISSSQKQVITGNPYLVY